MNSLRIQELIQVHRDGLLKNVIPFWMAHVRDPECGGYLHYLDRDGSVYHTDKSVWIQCRIAWMFALLYNDVARRPEWLAMSLQGIEFIEKHCFDTDGRMFLKLPVRGIPCLNAVTFSQKTLA